MHAGEVDVDETLVRRLLAEQMPRWADLPLERVASDGTDNAIHRLGDDLSVRLPRIVSAAAQVEKELRWLPRLAPVLPLPVPVPVAAGRPGCGYPWPWAVCRWVSGEPASPQGLTDPEAAARALAGFVRALRSADARGGPPPGEHNFERGAPLAGRDRQTRDAIAAVADEVDAATATTAWEAALATPAHGGPPVWIHGDLHAGNLLTVAGRLGGVLDFGGMAVGDPACDAMAAWTFLPAGARRTYRDALGASAAEWERGRGWALSAGLIALPYYRETNPSFAATARRWIAAALEPG